MLTLRPGETAELLLPDDLTQREADWLADFFLRLSDTRSKGEKAPTAVPNPRK